MFFSSIWHIHKVEIDHFIPPISYPSRLLVRLQEGNKSLMAEVSIDMSVGTCEGYEGVARTCAVGVEGYSVSVMELSSSPFCSYLTEIITPLS
jgi:hypothetical protein